MPIKNYTTKVPASRSIMEIQDSLVDHGATGVLFEYEKGTGRIESLKFLLEVNGNKIPFKLPVNWRRFQAVLESQGVKRSDEEDYCYRVAWRDIRDWVLSQMALFETEMVELPQVFLPYAMDANGTGTLYDRVLNSQFLLSDGK
jgi:hypothetical protein